MKLDPKIRSEREWRELMRSVEFSLQILKKSNEETAAATPQRELECSSWTVQQAQKWADENGLKFLLGPYDQFPLSLLCSLH